MLKLYACELCPECVACKAHLDRYGIEYEYLDINANLFNLKEFLKLRDNLEVFDRLKAIDDIGIPTLIKEDGEVFHDWQGYLEERGYKVEGSWQSCSIDGRGC